MVSLKSKLLSSLLYLLFSMYIFVRFVSSLLKPWFNEVGCVNEVGCTNEVGCVGKMGCGVGFVANKVEIRVSMVLVLVLILVLAKLFLRR